MAIEWLSDALNAATSILPRLTQVKVNEGAVKFVRGRSVALESGLHVYWPITSDVETVNISRQILNLSDQNIMTLDGEVVTVTGVIVFSISDVHKYIVETEDAEQAIDDIASSAIHDALISTPFDQLNSERDSFNEYVLQITQEQLDRFGVEVEEVKLINCAKGTVLIHTGSVSGLTT